MAYGTLNGRNIRASISLNWLDFANIQTKCSDGQLRSLDTYIFNFVQSLSRKEASVKLLGSLSDILVETIFPLSLINVAEEPLNDTTLEELATMEA
jgi:hypothetical protein